MTKRIFYILTAFALTFVFSISSFFLDVEEKVQAATPIDISGKTPEEIVSIIESMDPLFSGGGGGHGFGSVAGAASILTGLGSSNNNASSLGPTSQLVAAKRFFSYYKDKINLPSDVLNSIADATVKTQMGYELGLSTTKLNQITMRALAGLFTRGQVTNTGSYLTSNIGGLNQYLFDTTAGNLFGPNSLGSSARAAIILPEQMMRVDSAIATYLKSGLINVDIGNSSNSMPRANVSVYFDANHNQINSLILDVANSRWLYGVSPDGVNLTWAGLNASYIQNLVFLPNSMSWTVGSSYGPASYYPAQGYQTSISSLINQQRGTTTTNSYLGRSYNYGYGLFNAYIFLLTYDGEQEIITPYNLPNSEAFYFGANLSAPENLYYLDADDDVTWQMILDAIATVGDNPEDIMSWIATQLGYDPTIYVKSEPITDSPQPVYIVDGPTVGNTDAVPDITLPEDDAAWGFDVFQQDGVTYDNAKPIGVLMGYVQQLGGFLHDVFVSLEAGAPGLAKTYVAILTLGLAGGVVSKFLL